MSEEASSAVWLDDHLQMWKHLVHMLSGEEPVIRRLEAASFRPALELAPEDGAVALPERIDWFANPEQNRDAYRFQALQLAGRREFGTYEGAHLAHLQRSGDRLTAVSEVFALTEGVRVQARLAAAYPGCAHDAQRLAAAWLAREAFTGEPTFAGVCDTLLALALAAPEARSLPSWLPRATADRVLAELATLARGDASVAHSFALAVKLVRLLAGPIFRRASAGEPDVPEGESRSLPAIEAIDVFELASDDAGQERALALREIGPLEAAAEDLTDANAPQADAAPSGSMAGRGRAGEADPDSKRDAEPAPELPLTLRSKRPRPSTVQTFVYDEWDHALGDYQRRRCRVHELSPPLDAGAFFDHTLHHARPLLAEVRRQFERIRPARYRPLRGLPDGEDFDLNLLTEARIEARARRSPATRIYTLRTRQLRDVATLFLVDVSASTDQPYVEPGDPPARRIIDTIKEALVIMSMALQDLGDSYAIYAFSSQGPEKVEMYPIKAFDEVLSNTVRARIGGIEPRHGTRMGAALRHAITKLSRAHARARHLILLSDGFPQDHEYGPDRRSHTYGIEDTAVALREVTAAGATPFCITVDRAGHDYLRRMCDPSQYLVIDDVYALPTELPKIYRRVVRDG
jgi:nitric oxide reductase NorD protein